MMLLSGANIPLIYNKKDQIVYVMAEYDLDTINTKGLTKSFKTEYNKGIYRLSLKKWSEPPHFSQAFFDENKKIILLTSMTDRGFRASVFSALRMFTVIIFRLSGKQHSGWRIQRRM
jgi:hypothetical protein